MTDLRQAAQQALEALEWHYSQGHSNTLGGFRLKIDEKAIRDLKAALAAPVQEPVAWRWSESNGQHWFDWCTDWTHRDKAKAMGFPIEYAAPTQRPAAPEGGGNLPPPLQVPPEVAAALTTTDLAWLETRRLTRLWTEFGQMQWAGADEGWDRAIEAVRSRLNDECQAVLDWKAKADQSQATAVELLQRMKGLRDE